MQKGRETKAKGTREGWETAFSREIGKLELMPASWHSQENARSLPSSEVVPNPLEALDE